jgi:hypothetical protein
MGTALPDGSFTDPSTVPKVDWPKLAGARAIRQESEKASRMPARIRRRLEGVKESGLFGDIGFLLLKDGYAMSKELIKAHPSKFSMDLMPSAFGLLVKERQSISS